MIHTITECIRYCREDVDILSGTQDEYNEEIIRHLGELANPLDADVREGASSADVLLAEIKLKKGDDGCWLIMGDKDEIVLHIDTVFPLNEKGLIINKAREWILSK